MHTFRVVRGNVCSMKTNSVITNESIEPQTSVRRWVVRMLLLGLVLIMGAVTGCKQSRPQPSAAHISGTYNLVSVDGNPVPCSIQTGGHPGVNVKSGSFRIQEDGTCYSRIVFVAPGANREFTREVQATFTQSGSTLRMKWKGAGVTSGTIEGGSFEMINEGTRFSYRK